MKNELNKQNKIIFITFCAILGYVVLGYVYKQIFVFPLDFTDLYPFFYVGIIAFILSIVGFVLSYFLKQYKIPIVVTLCLELLYIIIYSIHYQYFDDYYFGFSILLAVLAISILMNKVGFGLVIGSSLSLIITVIRMSTQGYNLLGFITFLPDEFYVSLCLLVFGIIILCKKGKKISFLWFLPVVIYALSMLIFQLLHLEFAAYAEYHNEIEYVLLSFSFNYQIINLASLGVISLIIANNGIFNKNKHNTLNASNNLNNVTNSNSSIDNIVNVKVSEYYHSLGLFFVLLVFTGAIYTYYWIYKTTKLTNEAKGFDKREETSKLLLCMFIPFYTIFWAYETSKRIDGMLQEEGKSGDLAGISVVLMIFIPIVYYMMAQNKINELLTKK